MHRDDAASPSPTSSLLDAMMPRKSGIDALRELRAEGVETPALIVSAHQDEMDAGAPTDLEVSGYVTKPIDFDRLLRQHRRADRPVARLVPGDLEADLFAFQLRAVEELDRALGLVGVDLDEGEAVQDADVVDRPRRAGRRPRAGPSAGPPRLCRCARRG